MTHYLKKLFVHLPWLWLGETTDSISVLTEVNPRLRQPKAKVSPRFFSGWFMPQLREDVVWLLLLFRADADTIKEICIFLQINCIDD